MHYEINVTLNGSHFFATAERSLMNEDQALRAFETFMEKFPSSQGYEVTASLCQVTGRNVTEALRDKVRVKARAPMRKL